MSVLQNRPTRAALATTILLALIASMLLIMPRAQAQSMTPGPIPESRSINVSEDEFAVAWMPAQRATYYKVEYRRHDEQFVDNGEIIVSNKESLDLYAYVGSGNADTNYYVRVTPQRDDAADGPAHIQRVRTMASGERNPWDEFTFQNATLSELFPCNGGVLPLSREKIYKSSSSIRKYVDTCMIDIGSQHLRARSGATTTSAAHLLLDVHDALSTTSGETSGSTARLSSSSTRSPSCQSGYRASSTPTQSPAACRHQSADSPSTCCAAYADRIRQRQTAPSAPSILPKRQHQRW